MKICYIPKKFSSAHQEIIDQADAILNDYARQGYSMTLRQLFYQFVSRDLIPNKQTEYKRLGSIINDARLAGELDWDYMEDRTRNLAKQAHWDSPIDIIQACASQFHTDRWKGQGVRVEVWVEKEALASVIERAAYQMRCPYFCCRGYTSQSEIWSAGQRLAGYLREGQMPVILHLGDHDPSGIDMTRDMVDRLNLFLGHEGHSENDWELKRIALNMDQVEEYNPPPNPAKATDARFSGYARKFGDESWELDALDPATLHELIVRKINDYVAPAEWDDALTEERTHRDHLGKVADQWDTITDNLE